MMLKQLVNILEEVRLVVDLIQPILYHFLLKRRDVFDD